MAATKVYKNDVWGDVTGTITKGNFTANMWGETVTFYWAKCGKLVHLCCFKDFGSARSSYTQASPFGSVPSALYPARTCEFTVMALLNTNAWSTGTYYACLLHLTDGGNMTIRGNDTEMKKMMGIQITCTYIAAE